MSIDQKSSYYDVGGIETIDVMKAKMTPEQYEGYLLGNIIKYSSRCNHKGTKERDIEKIYVYAKQWQIKDIRNIQLSVFEAFQNWYLVFSLVNISNGELDLKTLYY